MKVRSTLLAMFLSATLWPWWPNNPDPGIAICTLISPASFSFGFGWLQNLAKFSLSDDQFESTLRSFPHLNEMEKEMEDLCGFEHYWVFFVRLFNVVCSQTSKKLLMVWKVLASYFCWYVVSKENWVEPAGRQCSARACEAWNISSLWPQRTRKQESSFWDSMLSSVFSPWRRFCLCHVQQESILPNGHSFIRCLPSDTAPKKMAQSDSQNSTWRMAISTFNERCCAMSL